MADERTEIDISASVEVDNEKKAVKSINTITNAVKRLSGEFATVNNNTAKLKEALDGLGLQDIPTSKITAILRSAARSKQQSEFSMDSASLGKVRFKGAYGDKEFKQLYEEFYNSIQESIKLQEDKLKDDLANSKQHLANETRESIAMVKNAYTRDYHKKSDEEYRIEKTKWLAYRNKHPENFIPLRNQHGYAVGSGLRSLGQQMDSLGPVGKILGGTLNTIGTFIMSPLQGFVSVLTGAVTAVSKFANASINASAEIEALKTNLNIVFGDQSRAESMFHEISQYAVKSPFGVQQTTEMAVLLKQSGVYASDLMDTLRMIGDTAGGNADKMKRIANNYAQIVSIGKASMLDMRQFAYAGIPIYKAVSEELGVSQEQLRQMISEGKVTSDIIEKVFKDLTGINGLFENATQKGAKTLKARIQNLKDAQQLFLASWGDTFLQKGVQQEYNKPNIVISAISKLEEFFTKGEHNRYLANINSNVESIKKYEDRTHDLKAAIKYAEDNKNPKLKKALEEALRIETEKKNKQAESSVHLEFYNAKMAVRDEILKEFDGMSLEDVKKKREEIYNEYLAQGYNVDGDRNVDQAKLNKKALKEMGLYPTRENEVEKVLREENEKKLSLFYAKLRAEVKDTATNALPTISVMDSKLGKGYERSVNFFKELGFEEIPRKAIIDISTGLYSLSDLTEEEKDTRKTSIKVLQQKTAEWLDKANDLINKADQLEEITEEDIKAHLLDVTARTQDEAYTFTDKAASKKDSLLNEISSLTIAISETEVMQKKEKEEQKKRWKDALEVLKSIDSSVSATGEVDITKLSLDKLFEIQSKGGFRSDKRLINDNDQWKNISPEERVGIKSKLKTNLDYIMSNALMTPEVSPLLSNVSGDIRKLSVVSENAWFDTLNSIITSSKNAIEKSDLSEELKTKWKILIGDVLLDLSTAVDLDKLDMSLLDEQTKSKVSNKSPTPPLWKRIESSALGIPIEALKGTEDNINAFMDSYSSKNISSKVFSAIGNIGIQQKLLKYYGVGKKDGDKIYQIDWKETLKSVKEFALSLDSSVEVINAYKDGLEDQRKTLMDLATSGIYTMENQGTVDLYKRDAKGKQLTGTKLTDLGSLDSVAIVNTFGERLVNITGDVLDIVDGKIVDKLGNKYKEEEVFVTGNIYEKLIEALKENSKELGEASVALRDATVKKELANEQALSEVKFREKGKLNGEQLLALGIVSGKNAEYVNETFKDLLTQAINSGEVFSKKVYVNSDNSMEKIAAAGVNSVPQGPLQSQAAVDAADSVKKYKSAKNPEEKYVLSETQLEGTIDSIIQEMLTNPTSEDAEIAASFYREALSRAIITGRDYEGAQGRQTALDYIDKLRDDSQLSSGLESYGPYSNKTLIKSIYPYGILGAQFKALGMPQELAGLDSIKEHRGLFDNDFKTNGDKQLVWAEGFRKALEDAYNSLTDIAALMAKDTFLAPFEAIGKSLGQAGTFSDNLIDSLADLGKTVLRQIGPLMAQCGLQIAASAAASANWPMVFAGLGLAAAGGVVTGFGAALDEQQDNSRKGDEQYEKAQDIKDQLAELLEQARKDALYYEMNLRHKKALGLNKEFSDKSVNDAIITPSGDVISTHPEDYLIATKTPSRLLGGSAPTNISFKVINNSPDVRVRQERRQNELGETELVAIIESVVTDYIAGPRGDDAFNSRRARSSGSVSIM